MQALVLGVADLERAALDVSSRETLQMMSEVRRRARNRSLDDNYSMSTSPFPREQESDARVSVHGESLSRFGGMGEKSTACKRCELLLTCAHVYAFTPMV
jgi:hypothetical protein